MRRGSTGSSSASGASKGSLQCTVKLLDGSNFQVEVNKKSVAQSTFDQVLRRLSIVDKEFFALEYEDEQKHLQWVDLQKPFKKQLKKTPWKVNFRVKYYPLDPMIPHMSCRNHLYRQLRNDIMNGLLKCPVQTTPCVMAYVLQADLGDFESIDKDMEYIMDMKLLLNESTDLHEEIARFHQLYRGMNVLEAVNEFLRNVRELETYGITLYDMRYEDSACQLGISPGGISIFRRNRRIVFQDLSVVSEVSFKNNKFLVVLSTDGAPDSVVSLEMESLKMCKDVWRISADYASFYSEPGRRVRESPKSADIQVPSADLLSQHVALPKSPQEDSPPSKVVPAQQKSRNLSYNLPSGLPRGKDPIAAALTRSREERSRTFSMTPTSPDDFTSLSSSASDRNMSPLSPLSPGSEGAEVDLILPGIPNLRDEDGRPLNSYPQQRLTPPGVRDEKEKPYKYRAYQEHRGESNQQNNGNMELHGQRIEPGRGDGAGSSVGDEAPPLPPPRNYGSQYRNDFHAKYTPHQNQSPARTRQNHHHHQGDLPGNSRQSSSDHATSNASLSQEVGGSLLDLADELGGGRRTSSASLHSSSGRRSHTDLGGASGYPRDKPNGKYSPRHGDRNSRTLPATFRSNGATPPDHSPHSPNFGPPGRDSPATGASPWGGDHNRKETGGRGVVRSWVQEQQFRTFPHSSLSQHSLDSSSSSQEQSSSSRSHPLHHPPSHHPPSKHSPQLHPPSKHSPQFHSTSKHSHPPSEHSPQFHSTSKHSHPPSEHSPRFQPSSQHSPQFQPPSKHSPQFHPSSQHSPQFHPSSQHSPQFHPSSQDFKASQASSRSSNSLPRGNSSSGDLQKEGGAEQDRWRSLSMEGKGVLNLRELDFSSKGGSRVYRQFREVLGNDEFPSPKMESRQDTSHDHRQDHRNGSPRDDGQRSHDQKQIMFDQHRSPEASHDQQQVSHDHKDYRTRSHDQQRSHDPHPQRLHDESHDIHQRSHEQRMSHDHHQALHDRQMSHDRHQGSHDQRRYQERISHDPGRQPIPLPPQDMPESNEFPLPTSPAPPPYKSPSPDSEQAQVLQKLEQQSLNAPRSQFVFHGSSLGMGLEQYTDLSVVDDTGCREGVIGHSPMVQRRSRSPNPRRRRAVSPRIQQQGTGETQHLSVTSATEEDDRLQSMAGSEAVQAAGNRAQLQNKPCSAAGTEQKLQNEAPSVTVHTENRAQLQNNPRSAAGTEQKLQYEAPSVTVHTENRAQLQNDPRSAAGGEEEQKLQIEARSVAVRAENQAQLQDKPGFTAGASSSTAEEQDILKEIEELMGGVEAMVSEANLEADQAGSRDTNADSIQGAGMLNLEQEQVAGDFLHTLVAPFDALQLVVPKAAQDVSLHHITTLPPHLVAHRDGNGEVSLDTSFPDAEESTLDESFAPISAPAGFSGSEGNREEEEEEEDGGLEADTGGPRTVVGGPRTVTFLEPHCEEDDEMPPMLTSTQGRRYTEDNLADILQEVMASDNLPPPPAHLMALSQELESQTQDLNGTDNYVRPSSVSPRTLPSIATTAMTSANQRQHESLPSTKKEDRPLATKHDTKLFSRKRVELPPLSYENVTLQSPGLPPEIANFMHRVRNFSADGLDSHSNSNTHLSQSSDLSNGKQSPATKQPLARRTGDEDGDNSALRDATQDNCVLRDPSLFHETEFAANVYPDTTASSPLNNGAVASVVYPVRSHDSLNGTKPSEARSKTEHFEDFTKSFSKQGSKTNERFEDFPKPVNTIESETNKHEQDSGSDFLRRPPSTASNQPNSPPEPLVSRHELPEAPTTNEGLHGLHASEKEDSVQQSVLRLGKTVSLPRGNVGDFHHLNPHTSASFSSHSSSPTTQSDLVAPVYPQRVQGLERGGLQNERSSYRVSRQRQPWSASEGQQEKSRDVEKLPREARRAQTFSSTSHPQRQQQAAHPRPADSQGDSLPNSPSYFSQLPPETRGTLSPGTQVENRSFQEHLDSLDTQTRVKKKKVLEWVQRSSKEPWDSKNKDGRLPNRLQLDPSSTSPAQQYQKQEPIYADLDSSNGRLDQEGLKNRNPGSLPNQSLVPEGRSGMARDQRNRMEPRQRVATVAGSKVDTYPAVSQRQYPPPARQHAGAHGIGGREVQGSAGRANIGHAAGVHGTGGREVWGSTGQPKMAGAQGRGGREVQGSTGQPLSASMPAAKFGKDYYVLDV